MSPTYIRLFLPAVLRTQDTHSMTPLNDGHHDDVSHDANDAYYYSGSSRNTLSCHYSAALNHLIS